MRRRVLANFSTVAILAGSFLGNSQAPALGAAIDPWQAVLLDDYDQFWQRVRDAQRRRDGEKHRPDRKTSAAHFS